MGRIKVFFCAFCLNRDSDHANNDNSFNQAIDVSHLATPHITSNSSIRSSPNVHHNRCESNSKNDEENHSHNNNHQSQQPFVVGSAIQRQSLHEQPQNRLDSSNEDASSSLVLQHHQDVNRSQQASPQTPRSSPLNLPPDHEQPSQPQSQPQQQQQQQQEPQQLQHQQQQVSHQAPQRPQQQQILAYEPANERNSESTPTKLSYDIISVREPLARILAERQQLQLAQQLQRQLLGDHEYIEVYGERGSSCFYEEIAGSTTSSATYDQIGVASNHNYQALINAYVAIRPPESNNRPNVRDSTISHNAAQDEENVYDVTYSTNPLSNAQSSVPQPSTSFAPPHTIIQNKQHEHQSVAPPTTTQQDVVDAPRNNILSESIPVYSVINKAARRSNAIMRVTVDGCRPPQPPPKNLMTTYQPSTSAIQQLCLDSSSVLFNTRSSRQIPATSSYSNSNNNISESNQIDTQTERTTTRLPQPPPRLSKLNATNRPLPLPDSINNYNNNNNCSAVDRNSSNNDDMESMNNGYELLTTNFDDDQIDVGYEKIRESNRYSGGSLSSQFCPLQAIDNDGYESVQPIYSSPSNALAEPNYEAIGPATASELAAAATARLTAFEQFLKTNQQISNKKN